MEAGNKSREKRTGVLMRKRAKSDDNQKQLVKTLRGIPGVSVSITSALGDGFPDIVVGYKKQNYLFEIKDGSKPPSQRKLTPDEEKFFSNWFGRVDVVCCLDDVLNILKIKL